MNWLPLNFALMRSPLNWLTVFLMVYIGSLAIDQVLQLAGVDTSKECDCQRALFPVANSVTQSES